MKYPELHSLLGDLSAYEVECYPDQSVKRLESRRHGHCQAVLELGPNQDEAEFRAGIAGERYSRGVVEPLGPFAGSGPKRIAQCSFEVWVRQKVEQMGGLTNEPAREPIITRLFRRWREWRERR